MSARGMSLRAAPARGLALAGVAIAALTWVLAPHQFLRAYLAAYWFWIGIALGASAVGLLHGLVGGGWGVPLREFVASTSGTIPWMAALFLPLVLGAPWLYPWAGPPRQALTGGGATYLTVWAFALRGAVYFAIWFGMVRLLRDGIRSGASRPEQVWSGKRRTLGALALILYSLTATAASIDWAMSLEPRWYSTAYGLVAISGQVLAALALGVVATRALGRGRGAPPPQTVLDLGNLLLTFLLLWAYVTFAQFLIIWGENLADEAPWFVRRSREGWQWVAFAIAFLHGAVPFALLLARDVKKRLGRLSVVAALLFAMHAVNVYWTVAPALQPSPAPFLAHLALFVALGGIWCALLLRGLRRWPLTPEPAPVKASS